METNPQNRRAERRYQVFVRRNLTRNFSVHLIHGMLGQTGFRLLNAPTFLPAYVLYLSGSDFAVGMALALQSLGMALTPLIGANLIEHRARVLPMGFLTGGAMRLSVLGIALSGLLLPPAQALLAIYFWLALFGLLQGMQGVIFNFLMSKVIPVSKRGRLTGLRNFLAGITAAGVALLGGTYFLGDNPDATGYSYTFVLAFVLTTCGLVSLIFTREPIPPTRRAPTPLLQRLGEIPALLRSDPAFTRYFVARSIATAGRMALPFYILYAGSSMALSGANLAIVTGASQGIGQTLALALAEAGADTALVSRNRAALDETAAEIESLGRQALVVPTDLTKVSEIRAMVDQVHSHFGKIDILLNNAAWTVTADALKVTEEEWDMIRLHPTIGANIVRSLKQIAHIAPEIHAHQEKYFPQS